MSFAPTTIGPLSGTLTIIDNSQIASQTVNLSGTGLAPTATLATTSLSFSSQALNTTSPVQMVTLNNTGNAALGISSVVLAGVNAGDFAQTNTCGNSVAAGGNCAINVTFIPSAAGTRTATVTITDNTDNVAGSTQTVSLTGTGTGPVASLSATAMPFGNQTLGTTKRLSSRRR